MHITVKNLGVIDQANFELGNLTLLCGKNNTGKTYLAYTLYGFLDFWRKNYTIEIEDHYVQTLLNEKILQLNIDDILAKADSAFTKASKEFTKHLPDILASSKKQFKNSSVSFVASKEAVNALEITDATMEVLQGKISKGDISIHIEKDKLITFSSTLEVDKQIISSTIHKDVKGFMADVAKFFLNQYLYKSFILSAERTGLILFKEELIYKRNQRFEEIFSQLDNNNSDIARVETFFNFIKDTHTDFNYPLPVKDNLHYLLRLQSVGERDSFISEEHPEILDFFEEIIGGKYIIENGDVYYIPYNSNVKLSMKSSSSSIRSLPLFYFYLKHSVRYGELLIIDEPELNLHPENQRLMARLLVRLLNIGVKIFVTTHSDYMIREFNTLMMLHPENGIDELQNIMQREGYVAAELLKAQDVRAYTTEEDITPLNAKLSSFSVEAAEIEQEIGIEVLSFDRTIEDINRIQTTIAYAD